MISVLPRWAVSGPLIVVRATGMALTLFFLYYKLLLSNCVQFVWESQIVHDYCSMSNSIPPVPNFTTPPSTPQAFIDFEYPGYFAAIDFTIKLFVNGTQVRAFSFKKPDKFVIPVTPGEVKLKAKLSFRSDSLKLKVEPGKRYQVFLTYNRFWGSISLNVRRN